MNEINKAQYKIFCTAKRKNNKIKLKEKNLRRLETAVTGYIDDKISYSSEAERDHLIQIMTVGLIEEVLDELKSAIFDQMMDFIADLPENSALNPIGI